MYFILLSVCFFRFRILFSAVSRLIGMSQLILQFFFDKIVIFICNLSIFVLQFT